MPASLLLAWREGVVAEREGEAFRVLGPSSGVVLRGLAPALVAALSRLTPPGEEEDRLAETVLEGGGAEALARWYYCLQGLSRRALVCRTVQAARRRLATFLPTSPTFAPGDLSDRPCLLSRFAYLHREGHLLVLESPLAHGRILLDDSQTLALLAALARPTTSHELAERVPEFPGEAIVPFLTLLAGAAMLQESGPGGEDVSSALRSWEFHDLLFHARSRKGRSDAPYGGTYRLAGQVDPPPAVKPAGGGESVKLYRPDLDRLERDDPSFTEVLERRRSLRTYGARPLTVEQLGEFLYRVARVKDSRAVETDTPHGRVRVDMVSRPYPSGGALYELEFYAVVHACTGLAPGLYHYEPFQHCLERLCGETSQVEQLLADAATSTGLAPERLQVLLVLAARLPRVAWKYASIAYALTLKHVGVVYQTLYLAATAMGLAPCAVGGGDADLFSRAAGIDYYAETSVGEFLLGSLDEAAGQEDGSSLSRREEPL